MKKLLLASLALLPLVPVVGQEDAALTLRAAVAKAGVRAPARPEPDEPDLVELGRLLFFDKVLSGDGEVSCASCHVPGKATGDGLPVTLDGRGVGRDRGKSIAAERLLGRNTPAL